MNGEGGGLSAKGSARRKLIRGSFAVPAVLTLQHGGALAASSINACLVRQNRYPATQFAAPSDDVWLRYRLWGYTHPTNGMIAPAAGLWIRGSDLSAYAVNGNSIWLSQNAFQRFELSTNSLVTPVVLTQPPGPQGFAWARVNVWVSLRVDQNGNLTGAGSTGAGSAVSDSCWNSFAAGVQL